MRAGVKYALAGVGVIGITYLVIALINGGKRVICLLSKTHKPNLTPF